MVFRYLEYNRYILPARNIISVSVRYGNCTEAHGNKGHSYRIMQGACWLITKTTYSNIMKILPPKMKIFR